MTTPNENSAFRSFLLGTMNESEWERMCERMSDESDLLERLDRAEDDLIEEAIRGKMPEADRENFFRHFLVTASRKERYNVIEAIHQVVQTRKGSSERNRSFLAWTVAPPAKWSFVAAAAVFAIVAGAILISTMRNSGVTDKVTEEHKRNQSLAQEVASLRAQLGSSQTGEGTLLPPIVPLIKDEVRSGTKQAAPPLLTVPSTGHYVIRLEPTLPKEAAAAAYNVSLVNIDEQAEAWTDTLHSVGGALELRIPSQALKTGDYVLTVQAKEGAFRRRYELRIIKQ